ncbi:MAG: lipid II flippase MurJ, partial [Romboutsia sp.]
MKQILYLVIPVFFGSYVTQINVVLNRTLASTLEKGSITALNYANKLSLFAVGVIVIALSTVMYPILSKLVSENNMERFKISLSKSINSIIILMVPIMVIIMFFSTLIVKILFEEGSFDTNATYLTSTALFYYSIGIVAYGLREILAKGFYSLQDTKTPVKNATISVGINIIFSITLVKKMGIGGLALASSISAILTTILLFISLRKKIGKLGFKNIFITFIKVSIASIIMGIVMKYIYNSILKYEMAFIWESRKFITINSIISVVLGILIYIVLIIIFNIKEVREVIYIILNKIKNINKKYRQ